LSDKRIFNFSAGPAILPEEVLRRAQDALWNFGGAGFGVAECSHRGPEFTSVLDEAEANIRELASISDDYAIAFLQGGASMQFAMLPMNFLAAGKTADYINTGSWSKKAIAEAKRVGEVHVAATSADENFSYIPSPDAIQYSAAPEYVHITSNNTIFGTEWQGEPEVPEGVPLFCDASSDIFSRPIDVSKYGMIYAGAQKNLGPAGVTLVIIRKDVVERGASDLPPMLQYRTHVDAKSCYNTPPVFPIFVVGEVIKWIKGLGGLEAMAERNRAKAAVIYDFLDQSDFYRPTARSDSRSLMNVCFRAPSEELDKKFVAEAKARGLSGLKGHRSVGGMRASIYNAFPAQGCEALVTFMKEFEQANR
jgi:phosphoserine aminotransferase